MKLNIHLLVAAIMFFAEVSCKKTFLDVPDNSFITLQGYVKDLSTTNEYLNGGVYTNLSKDFYFGYYHIYPDLIADNIKLVSAGSSNFAVQYKWAQQADDLTSQTNNINLHWKTGYQIIRSCSFVINKAEEYRNQDIEKAENIKGQAFAIRALIHFVLVNEFAQPYNFTTDGSHAGIPYVTVYDWNEPVSGRQTVSSVYDNIIFDLNSAIELLSVNNSNTVIMNRNAAKALLARVLLFKGDFTGAKNLSREVLVAKPLMTGASYPSKLFTLQETEALFQLPPSATGVNGGTYSTNLQGRYFQGTSSQVQFFATTDVTSILIQNPSDVRKAWIKSGGAGKDTITKYPVNSASNYNPKSGDYYQTLIRSSELCLTAAEAYAKINKEDSARYFLNQIRTRANLSALTNTISGAPLLDSIYLERRRELCFEGFRMFDLLRWRKGVNRTDAWFATAQALPYPSNMAIAPIPGLDVSVTGLEQNAGY